MQDPKTNKPMRSWCYLLESLGNRRFRSSDGVIYVSETYDYGGTLRRATPKPLGRRQRRKLEKRKQQR